MEYTISEEKLQNIANKILLKILLNYEIVTFHRKHFLQPKLDGDYIEAVDSNQDYKVMFSYLDTHVGILVDYDIFNEFEKLIPTDFNIFNKLFVNFFRETFNVNVEGARLVDNLGHLDIRNINHTKLS